MFKLQLVWRVSPGTRLNFLKDYNFVFLKILFFLIPFEDITELISLLLEDKRFSLLADKRVFDLLSLREN